MLGSPCPRPLSPRSLTAGAPHAVASPKLVAGCTATIAASRPLSSDTAVDERGPEMPNVHQPLHTIAVILAGGTGLRVGLDVPKQLLKVAGKPIIEHTLQIFDRAPEIDDVLVMMAPGFVSEVQQIIDRAGLTKTRTVLEGGATRNETTRRALDHIGEKECNVLFHDAVRPLLDHRIIADCVAALRDYEAVDVVIPSADTIVVVEDGKVVEIPNRERLRRGQTPQAFRASTIRCAYERSSRDPDFNSTDDCSVVLRYLPHVTIAAVTGADHNMKVTHPVDVFLADKLFQLGSRSAPPPESHNSYGNRLTGRTLVVFGGSYGIGRDISRIAESWGADVFAFSRSLNATDVTRHESMATGLKRAYDATGRIDYVVNTAGILTRGVLEEMSEADIEGSIACNFRAPVFLAQLALPYLKQTHGQLLLFTSSSYTRGRAGYSLYSSTKAAVVNLTQALADEWSEFAVRVNCVNPERTRTPMRERAFGVEPVETLLTSEDVALTSLDTLLASLTGQVIDVRIGLDDRTRAPRDNEPIVEALDKRAEMAAEEAARDLRRGPGD